LQKERDGEGACAGKRDYGDSSSPLHDRSVACPAAFKSRK
jgi:hypothetical protein